MSGSGPGSDIDPDLAPLVADTDRPYLVRSFRRNIRRAKFAIGGSLAAALVLGAGHLVLLHRTAKHEHKHEIHAEGAWINTARWWADIGIMCFTVSQSADAADIRLRARPSSA